MQIIIPMTGYGSRFVAAGYRDLKPFIKVQGRAIIDWIVRSMYTPDDHFVFVCRAEHLRTLPWMREYLLGLAPDAEIFAIEDWTKLGPVVDVLRAAERIDDATPAIINYCDFYMAWDWKKFQQDVTVRGCDGCVPCYSGFHPHLLPAKNLYASCKVDADENLIEIREKYSFAADKTKARHSPGTYYFRTGALLKTYCQRLVDSGEKLKGEYYASLPYNAMVQDGLTVWAPACVDWFCQWGTPEDLAEYLFWTETVRRFAK